MTPPTGWARSPTGTVHCNVDGHAACSWRIQLYHGLWRGPDHRDKYCQRCAPGYQPPRPTRLRVVR